MYNVLDQAIQDGWALYHGDSVEILQNLPDECIDLTVTSPPFGTKLYTYTPTEHDLSNGRSDEEFFEHFDYIIEQLFRITKAGRNAAIHVMDVPAMKMKHGYIGMTDFSGEVIHHFEKSGWIFGARIPIDKSQQAQAIRTHAIGLTMRQKEKDRAWLRPAIPDYILKFRKPGVNKVPVVDHLTNDEWIEYANPTWSERETSDFVRERLDAIKQTLFIASREAEYSHAGDSQDYIQGSVTKALAQIREFQGQIEKWLHQEYPASDDRCADIGAHATWYGIREGDTLQGWQQARAEEDELHVCALQLPTIERCIRLWTNPLEIVLDPFSGIGSTGYIALAHGRKYIGCELKNSYHAMAVENLKRGEREAQQEDLFSLAGIEVENTKENKQSAFMETGHEQHPQYSGAVA